MYNPLVKICNKVKEHCISDGQSCTFWDPIARSSRQGVRCLASKYSLKLHFSAFLMTWNTGFERVNHDVKEWQLKHSGSVLYPLTDPRDPRSQRGPNSFIFMQFLAKYLQNNRTLGVGAPSSGKSWIHHCKAAQSSNVKNFKLQDY